MLPVRMAWSESGEGLTGGEHARGDVAELGVTPREEAAEEQEQMDCQH
jgi:hypothetical protein